jgi:hypothetical protein
MGLLRLVLLHLLVCRRLRREDTFSFLAHVIQYMEKSRACAYGNIINYMIATVNIHA